MRQVCRVGSEGEPEHQLAGCLGCPTLRVDDRQAHQLALVVEADRVALGGLVESDGSRRVSDREVEHVGVRVVVDAVKDSWTDMDAHGLLLRGNAVMTPPSIS
jgi:hypothetical protein